MALRMEYKKQDIARAKAKKVKEEKELHVRKKEEKKRGQENFERRTNAIETNRDGGSGNNKREKSVSKPAFWNSVLYGKAVNVSRPISAGIIRGKHDNLKNAEASRPHQADGHALEKKAKHRPVSAAPASLSDLYQALAKVEDKMRDALKKRRKAYITEKEVFINACRKSGVDRIVISAKNKLPVPEDFGMTQEQFQKIWLLFSISLNEMEVEHFFRKYGQTTKGHLPCKVFAEALLVGRSKLMGMNAKVQFGAFEKSPQPKPGLDIKPKKRLPDQPRPGGLKIIYPECRKGVFTPSTFDVDKVDWSSRVPDASLQLEHVYGYAGLKNTATNLYYTQSEKKIVYYTAAVGIVLDIRTKRQKFFCGHTDDITSLSISSDRNVVATGQVTSRSEEGGKANPYVCIWSCKDDESCCKEVVKKLIHEGDERGIIASCFSPACCKEAMLITVTTDNNHTVHLWNWMSGELMSVRKGRNGAPPQIYGAVWSPFESTDVMTYGVHHISFWKVVNQKLIGPQCGDFSKVGVLSILSAVFLSPTKVATGVEDGSILIWKKKEMARSDGPPAFKCIKRIAAHARGPTVIRPDGAKTHNGVRGLALLGRGTQLISGGADGNVIVWKVDEQTKEPFEQMTKISLKEEDENVPPAIRSLDFSSEKVFIAGTNRCDVWEVDESPSVIVDGHHGQVKALASHPKVSTLFITASYTGRLYVWDNKTRALIDVKKFGTDLKAASAAFSPLGDIIAIGFTNGGIKLLAFPSLADLFWTRTFTSSVDTIKFSPDGKYLAAGSHDAVIDIFDISAGGVRKSRCKGHSSTVSHLDWSTNCKYIMTTSTAYEILYFDAQTGNQVLYSMNDVEWDTYTCTLGFSVMGIWPTGSDGTDINSCDRSHRGKHIVTADDFGRVCLFNYPCIVRQAPCRSYRGHSSHVMNITFNANDKRVVSVGGNDRAVFQWRTRNLREDEEPQKPNPVHENAPWALHGDEF